MDEFDDIKNKIKGKRKILGLTQVEFSNRIGLGLATIRDIEQGKRTIKLSSLFIVLDALGLRIEIKDK